MIEINKIIYTNKFINITTQSSQSNPIYLMYILAHACKRFELLRWRCRCNEFTRIGTQESLSTCYKVDAVKARNLLTGDWPWQMGNDRTSERNSRIYVILCSPSICAFWQVGDKRLWFLQILLMQFTLVNLRIKFKLQL